ncbi:MAG: hypothetical protein NXI00_09535 [Cytophagales bacterium]|nr:hypothetical protein [Cytophagales bacterium]
MKKIIYIFISLIVAVSFTACEKVDPFVDRVVSPVLVQIMDSSGGSSSGLTTDPTVNATFGTSAKVGIKVLELDKTNILDYTKGIDSLPVTSLALEIKFRGGSSLGTFTTGSDGVASVEIPWADLGVTGAGSSVSLTASGSYKDQSFTKLFKIASK